jgi:DNA-binding transcriptional MerR regulator
VAKVRVYELAKQLGVTSKTLLSFLKEQDEFLRSAASIIEPPVVERVLVNFPKALRVGWAPKHVSLPPQHRDRWPDDDDDDRPVAMTAVEAASMCGVLPLTIRQWVTRGYLRPIGRKGRSNLFDIGAVHRAQDLVLARTRKPVEARRGIASKDLDRQVTTAVAARVVGVSPSTIRMWVHRGHLMPVPSPGRSHTFIIQDVLRAARRRSHRRSRRNW